MSEFGDKLYVAFRPCGCFVGFVLDIPGDSKRTAKSVADFIKRGDSIRHMDYAEYNANYKQWGMWHRCPHGANPKVNGNSAQIELIAEGR